MVLNRAQFHGSAYRRILRLRSRFSAFIQALNFCAILVSVECLVTRSTHGQKPKFSTNPWNTLAVSTKFPASISADAVLTVSRAMKLDPDGVTASRWKHKGQDQNMESGKKTNELINLCVIQGFGWFQFRSSLSLHSDCFWDALVPMTTQHPTQRSSALDLWIHLDFRPFVFLSLKQ